MVRESQMVMMALWKRVRLRDRILVPRRRRPMRKRRKMMELLASPNHWLMRRSAAQAPNLPAMLSTCTVALKRRSLRGRSNLLRSA